MKLHRTAAYILFFISGATACKKDTNNGATPAAPTPTDTTVTMTPYSLPYPAFFPEAYIPDDNKLYTERIALGRMLYYDTRLSNDGRACAGCHLQSYGFTSPNIVSGMPVLPHINIAWYTNFMWDGSKSGSVEDVMLYEVKDFFGTDLNKINAIQEYKTLFKKYYGSSEITYKDLSYALAQFIRTLISSNTKYDQFLHGQATLTNDEYYGMRIFFTERGDCFHCHINPVMTDNLFHNTGVDSIYVKEADKGYYNVTHNAADLGKFRTPNLRNVALRTSFMHDGRYKTLEEVVEFYNNGVHRVNTLDPIMTKPGKENGLQLTESDKRQLVAFLRTLTDSTMITDPGFSRP